MASLDPQENEKKKKQPMNPARKLLAQADAILHAVEETELVRLNKRSYPTFARSEVKLGRLLGQGGFGHVHEILDFECKPSSTTSSNTDNKKNKDGQTVQEQLENELNIGEAFEDEPHYHVDEARQLMKARVQRNGDARYAIKRVKDNLKGDVTRVRAMIDLATEATYLSALLHPNIVKMRAISDSKMIDRSFFIIMDRLFDTLAVRVKTWQATHKKIKGGLFGRGANKEMLHSQLVERLTVAYDLASAYRYLHDNKIVYRDIRKENIGFDVRGDVKVFDFGLSKSLSPELKCKKDGKEVYGYHLTPCTGSIPFMAPEIVQRFPYDTQCDVFSFAILLWEMLAMKPAFGGRLTPPEYRQRVVFLNERPSIGRDWPVTIKQMLQEAWDDAPQKRPNMTQVAAMIRTDLNKLTKAANVRQRSVFMRNRSANSFRLFRAATPHESALVSTAA